MGSTGFTTVLASGVYLQRRSHLGESPTLRKRDFILHTLLEMTLNRFHFRVQGVFSIFFHCCNFCKNILPCFSTGALPLAQSVESRCCCLAMTKMYDVAFCKFVHLCAVCSAKILHEELPNVLIFCNIETVLCYYSLAADLSFGHSTVSDTPPFWGV